MKSEQITSANKPCRVITCGAGKSGVPTLETAPVHGESSPSRIEKARKFWQHKDAVRKMAGRCGRCGKPNDNGVRQCDTCREWMQGYRLRKKQKPVTVDGSILAALERRIVFLEIQLANMQLASKVQYKRGFSAAMRARLRTVEMPESKPSYEDLQGTDFAQ